MAAQIVAQMAAGFAVIATRRTLLRATVTSVVSYAGIGMLLVCCPVLGAQRLGAPARGALLISVMAVASLAAGTTPAGEGKHRSGGTDRSSFGTMTLIFATMRDMQRTQWWPIA